MEQVMQKNAANSEALSAAEELASQAQELSSMVGHFAIGTAPAAPTRSLSRGY
jgi:methyl-accepting chemotaxis protein